MAVKTLGKRILAIALAAIMCFSAMHLTPLAETYEDQVMNGYYILNEDHSVNSITGTAEREQSGFTVSKTIRQTGLNQFDVTLKVVTSQEVTTNDAAIQLVIDTSSSMQYCAEDCGNNSVCRKGHGNRMDAVKSILTQQGGFLDSLTAGNTGKIYVSIVTFGESASAVCDWTDIKTAEGLAAVKSAISDLRYKDNATNLHAGLMLARNRLGMSEVANAAAKFTVLLSDGYANCYSKDSTSNTSISRFSSLPGGPEATPEGTNRAKAMAATLKTMSSVYAVGYGVTRAYMEDIIGSSGNVFIGTGAASVSSAFADIAQSAISGMDGAGSTVTDPMGEFIVLGSVSGNGVSANGNALTWKLDPANAEKNVSGNVTTYTYTFTYPITLDTAAQGFRATNDDGSVKYYPANGYTYLTAVINGENVEIPFNVPGVCGKVPQYDWRIEYYLENAEGGYTLEESKDMGAADLWTSVSAPEGYETKYSSRNYEFASGNTTIQITAGENVMKLYYDFDMANVTVNHFYKSTIIEADGTVTKGEYPEIPQISDFASKWIGTSFTASQKNNFGGAIYELDKADPKDAEITVSADESENVINFYYSREEDRRAVTSAEVKHIYKTYGYELQAGKYVLVEKSSVTESAQSAMNLKATDSYAVTATAPLSGYEGYTLNTAAGDYAALLQADNTLSFILAENAEENVRTLVFEKTVDERVPVQVTVNHYYTKTTTSVVEGNVVTTVAPNNELGKSDSFAGYYAGETFEAIEYNAFGGENYFSDADNAAKCDEIILAGDTVIDLYYNLTVAPKTVSITVNHYWRTFTDVTVEKTDSETGEVIGTEVITETTVDHKVEDILVSELYAGQNYTAALMSYEGGYTFNEAESNRTIVVENGAEINLYYDRSATDDARTDASIDVLHKYTTFLTTIVGGEVKTVTLDDGDVSEDAVTMKAGDIFTAIAKSTYKENTYTQITAEDALTVVLQPGTNATVVIEYEREASDLVDTSYNVNYVYNTYTMTVNEDGVAGYWNAPAVETTGSVANVAGFVGQQVTLSAGEREGFAPLAGNPATVQILKAEDNTWTFVYEKYIPLGLGSVTVNHHYKTTTIAENGSESVTTEDVLGTAVQMYLGESFLAENVSGSFQLVSATVDGSAVAAQDVNVVISGDNVVDFYYEKTVDNSRLVHYTISHIYNLYTYNGTLISSSKADDITGSGFVTTEVTAVADPAGYDLVSVSYNDAALEAPYTISLADGRNEIVFVYEKYQPREEVEVTVIHNYYEDEVSGDPVEVYEEIIPNISEDTEYTAEIWEEDGFEFHSADPELVITVTKDGENEIIVNYVRIVEEPPVEEPPVEEPPVEEPPVEEPPVEEPPVEEPPVVEIPEEEVPMAPAPEAEAELVEIFDEEVPLASVPKTGDATVLYAALTGLSGIGLAILGLKKKENNEE